jgi:hypothetical protein
LIDFLNKFQQYGFKMPHTRSALSILALIRENVIMYSFARLFCFEDLFHGKDFKFEMIQEACRYQYSTFEQIISGNL